MHIVSCVASWLALSHLATHTHITRLVVDVDELYQQYYRPHVISVKVVESNGVLTLLDTARLAQDTIIWDQFD